MLAKDIHIHFPLPSLTAGNMIIPKLFLRLLKRIRLSPWQSSCLKGYGGGIMHFFPIGKPTHVHTYVGYIRQDQISGLDYGNFQYEQQQKCQRVEKTCMAQLVTLMLLHSFTWHARRLALVNTNAEEPWL